MNCLELVDLYKTYEGKPLLDGVSFEVRSGEILCLLGSSGSGKSTILRIIAGIEKPDSGSVKWNGSGIDDLPVYRRNFGLMFQDYALFPHLSVAENIAFGLRMRRFPKAEIQDLVIRALTRVNLEGFASRRVTDLSGGEQQRIALARALAPDPQLLMLDEPLAALDRSLRVELQAELRSTLHNAGIPVIYVTHDQEEALLISDRLALLHAGRIVQCDLTERVFRQPVNRWAAQFLGMTNFLSGKVISIEPLAVEAECGVFLPSIPLLGALPKVGQKVTLLIKPLGITPAEADETKNILRGEVLESQFLGDHYKVRIQVCGDAIFELSGSSEFRKSEHVSLKLEPQDLILLPE
jgi:ABC-type Fe3+/spermidine/putrescine transport system ATPase subunit